jgi:polar amino acid transport system substrate-binding protein
LRIAKSTILTLISLMLIAIGCGKNEKEVPSAAESMRKHKKVAIVTDATNAPFEFGAGTGVQGLDVELGNEIGKDLDIEVNWVKGQGYEHLFELLGKGEAEIVISAIAADPKKENEFAFSKPYYESGDVIAHQRSVFDIKDLSSLSGKTVGVCTGRPGDAFMSARTGVTVKRFKTLDDALGALNRTELNAVVGDEIMLSYSSFNSYPNTTTLAEQVNKYKYVVAVRKGEAELLSKINGTIDRLKSSGELKKLVDTWIDDVVNKSRERGKADKADDDRKKAPKTINVNIVKSGGSWNMDRLDGFKLVLEGTAGRYESTPILTEGNRGNCKFTQPVPPGEYKLNISILRMTAKVPVPDYPKTSLAMDLNISSNGISIVSK